MSIGDGKRQKIFREICYSTKDFSFTVAWKKRQAMLYGLPFLALF